MSSTFMGLVAGKEGGELTFTRCNGTRKSLPLPPNPQDRHRSIPRLAPHRMLVFALTAPCRGFTGVSSLLTRAGRYK